MIYYLPIIVPLYFPVWYYPYPDAYAVWRGPVLEKPERYSM